MVHALEPKLLKCVEESVASSTAYARLEGGVDYQIHDLQRISHVRWQCLCLHTDAVKDLSKSSHVVRTADMPIDLDAEAEVGDDEDDDDEMDDAEGDESDA